MELIHCPILTLKFTIVVIFVGFHHQAKSTVKAVDGFAGGHAVTGRSLCEEMKLNQGWVVWNPSRSAIMLSADVPFTIHNKLLEQGYIKDPYFRFNDKYDRWISTDNWVAAKEFTIPSFFIGHAKTNLVFKSIDTIADVYLNDMKIGSSRNKFVEYSFEVSKYIKQGRNSIKVFFTSAIEYSKRQSIIYKAKYNYSVLPNCYPAVLHGECHSNFIRKEPCSFGWDFGPSLPTQGLLNSVYLEAYSVVKLKDTVIRLSKSFADHWKISVCLNFEILQANITLIITLNINEVNDVGVTEKFHFNIGMIEKCMTMELNEDFQLKEWWPRQFGGQNLYSLETTVFDEYQKQICSKKKTFGLRTVELIQESIPGSPGLSFYFKVNGRAIFMKGSNWIPADALRDRVTNATIDEYLQAAIDANINILRVWGGGGYESDHFYQTCDRLGLMIWHDLMFACAMYPTNIDFIESVKHEINFQVQRLQHHPSIITWSANNENEVALRENWYGTQANFDQYKKDYISLYVNTIKPLVAGLDPTRPFIVSSPSNGKESEAEGWIAKKPRSPLFGDVHYYNYAANCWNIDLFPKARFASEYGYQAYSSFEAMQNISITEDLKWNSTFMFYRQHHQSGNQQIENMIKQNFKLPVFKDDLSYFKRMIYMSQIVQSLCVTFETEHYRRLRGRLVKSSSNAPMESNQEQKAVKDSLGNLNRKVESTTEEDKSSGRLIKSGIETEIMQNEQLLQSFSTPATGCKDEYKERQHLLAKLDGNIENTDVIDKSHDSLIRSGNKVEEERPQSTSRANKKSINSDTLMGHTMGAMYWQLNDIWQAPSWASIEYGGKWKMLHYYAKNFFRDIVISYYEKKNNIEVFVASDKLKIIYGANLNITVQKWSSFDVLKHEQLIFQIPPEGSSHIKTLNVADWCRDPSQCFIILNLTVLDLPDVSYSRPVYLTPFSMINGLSDPHIVIPKSSIFNVSSNRIQFTLTGKSPAAFVWLSTKKAGKFSDNGFVLHQSKRLLSFTGRETVDVDRFKNDLTVTSLYDVYRG